MVDYKGYIGNNACDNIQRLPPFFRQQKPIKSKVNIGDKNKQNLDDKSKQIMTLPEHLGQRVLSPSSPIIEVVSNGMDFVVALCP